MTAPQPVPCVHCRNPVVDTVCGWTHVDVHRGTLLSWLCPLPHMTLATVPDALTAPPPVQQPAPPPVPTQQPPWVDALTAPKHRGP